MVDSVYALNRRKYLRPQAMLFSDNPGYISNDFLVPDGTEFQNFIVLSDDNRGAINMSYDRIESRVRTVNGRMRSYHVADKLKIDVSWDMLPSRAFAEDVTFTSDGFAEKNSGGSIRQPGSPMHADELYTTDKGAGGVDLLDWYESHPGSFWVFLAYDKYTNFDTLSRSRLSEYNDVVEVFFSDFQYSVEKRGSYNHDFWNVSLSLEEV